MLGQLAAALRAPVPDAERVFGLCEDLHARFKGLTANAALFMQRQLPADRRPTMLDCYREWRIETVKRLRTEIAELDAGIAAAGDKAERSRLRTTRQITKCTICRLAKATTAPT